MENELLKATREYIKNPNEQNFLELFRQVRNCMEDDIDTMKKSVELLMKDNISIALLVNEYIIQLKSI